MVLKVGQAIFLVKQSWTSCLQSCVCSFNHQMRVFSCVKLPDLDAMDEKVVFPEGPEVKGQALLHPAAVEVAVDEDTKLAVGGTDDDAVGPALEKVVVATAPVEHVEAAGSAGQAAAAAAAAGANSHLLRRHAAVKGKQPRLASADEGIRHLS